MVLVDRAEGVAGGEVEGAWDEEPDNGEQQGGGEKDVVSCLLLVGLQGREEGDLV